MNEQPNEYEKAIAGQKSYIGPAVLTFFLYWLFFIPGLLVNILYLKDARKNAKIAGKNPSGYGCLIVLLVWSLLPFIGLILLILTLAGVITLFDAGTTPAPFTYTTF